MIEKRYQGGVPVALRHRMPSDVSGARVAPNMVPARGITCGALYIENNKWEAPVYATGASIGDLPIG